VDSKSNFFLHHKRECHHQQWNRMLILSQLLYLHLILLSKCQNSPHEWRSISLGATIKSASMQTITLKACRWTSDSLVMLVTISSNKRISDLVETTTEAPCFNKWATPQGFWFTNLFYFSYMPVILPLKSLSIRYPFFSFFYCEWMSSCYSCDKIQIFPISWIVLLRNVRRKKIKGTNYPLIILSI